MSQVITRVSDEHLRNLLCCALEGGSNYWYTIVQYIFPKGTQYSDFQENGKHALDEYWHPTELIPFVDDCGMVFADEDAAFKPVLLNREALEKGVQVMSDKYPAHFSNLMSGNEDAETGDVFLQCCLFGEIIFS